MFVCVCNAVTDHDIRAAVGNGISSLEALGRELKVGTCCGRCKDCARKLLRQSMASACSMEDCAMGSTA